MQPLVCVIIVNYNGTNDTIECLKSLELIHYDNFKVVIVDNGSKDIEILEKAISNDFSKVQLIKNKDNLGFSGGNNLGIDYAKNINSEYVLLLNNDTIVEKEFLQYLIETAEKNENIGIGCGKICFFHDKDLIWFAGGEAELEKGFINHLGYEKKESIYSDKEKKLTFATGCLMLIPMKVINNIGLLDETYFLYSEDLDYCCRVINKGYEICYNPRVKIYHKVNASTGFGSPATQYYKTRNDLILIKKYVTKRKKTKAYFMISINVFKRVLRKRIKLKYVIMAYVDFIKRIEGKKENL